MDEKIYEVTGWQYGEFADSDGKILHYATLFCLSEITGTKDKSRNFIGSKAHSFKCASPDVLSGVKEGDLVSLYFNQYQKVCLIKVMPE